ncbi:MAG: hypothetical protein AAFW69_10890, partial [Pseudomonadota bacterium]
MRRLLLVLLLLLPVPVAAQFLGFTNGLVDFALEQISVEGELEITAEGVEQPEDGATDIVGIRVADGRGVWLEIDRVSMRWNARRLLRGEVEVSRLAAEGVRVLRRPDPSGVEVSVNEESALAEEDGDPFDWPRSPITLRIDELAALRVE